MTIFHSDVASVKLSCNPFFKIWICKSVHHYLRELNMLLKTLTSWTQRDKTLQETATFTDKKKIACNYSDPGGISGEIELPKTLI